ncbi:uncharacterized protein LOC112570897 isoform X2 [Pomacea canaliculata]|uniref:uncharacterized protein LOC112570897 isoform X2 n=1 Tax=Pomacea canaliculata TaxID=400727 RepID=UPI000D73D37E|nr:uncharacterized protein LOC112570897 isoform X2 [Pomacea canaliculata]
MADFWNYKVIGKPISCKLKVSTIDHADILLNARKTLEECVQYFIKKDPLDNESFILQRLIYMKNGQLRREKSFQGLKQILSAIRRLKDVDLQAIFNDIHEDFKQARCRSLSEAYQKWYQDLYPVLFVLTPTNVRWLPEGQELPCDLEAWQKSHGFTPALQESSLEVLIDDWAVLLKKYESVHGDDIEEQMTDISEIDRLPDLDLGYLDEDVGESVSLNEAATTWSAGRDEQFIKNKSEKKKKMKEAKKEKKEKQRLSQKDLVIPWDADITHKIEEASSFGHLLTFLKQWRNQLCHRHDIRHDKCHSALISLRKKARKAMLKNNPTQHSVFLQNAKKKLSKFLKWTIKNKNLKSTKKPKRVKSKSTSISESI